ncbi:MAG: PEP-CTERM sorting domain-containing protein [Alkalilacustris sp.]
MKLALTVAAASLAIAPFAVSASTVVTDFGAGSPWVQTRDQGDASVAIVDLTGAGGNLENDAPLPGGAVRFETTANSSDAADIGVVGNFGTVRDIFNGDLSFSYSLFKEDVGAAENAPALKLSFFNPDVTGTGIDSGFVQLIFEPYWNQPGFQGSSRPVPTGEWLDYDIGFESGLFWATGGFGEPSGAGGPPLRTLAGWLDAFNADFDDAVLFTVAIGVGTNNLNLVSYVDNVTIAGTALDGTFDFEAAGGVGVIPVPAALPLLGGGLAMLGFVGWRKRRSGLA